MRIIETKVFKFSELELDAQEKAVDNLRDINVHDDWWDYIYEDAKSIGIQLNSFDLDRRRHAEGEIVNRLSHYDVALAIIRDHGKDCETYKEAKDFLADRHRIKKEGKWPEKHEDSQHEFLRFLLESYSIMLQNEYEYMVSDDAVKETIEANEYEFTEEGKLC